MDSRLYFTPGYNAPSSIGGYATNSFYEILKQQMSIPPMTYFRRRIFDILIQTINGSLQESEQSKELEEFKESIKESEQLQESEQLKSPFRLCCNRIKGRKITIPLKCKAKTHQAPNAMLQHNNGTLYGLHQNPPQFRYNSTEYANLKQLYKNSFPKCLNPKKQLLASKSSDSYMTKLKSKHLGKSLQSEDGLTFKCYDSNIVKSKLRRVRSVS
jgi:hypothetical protein